ncbi:MAG: outer membrane insertion C- signal [Lunatimonas sp.]|uniref:outer membrane insertion C- signal n=1 Tax=Lunatimonas sp. TaxID=2060141 RepID=UPI00263ACD74|nr:outer membrane insertion C- signal [Lunatimonas sp.]MCC5937066.1 outer membrane insertion C- signal [Lunatimonas sp.]
MNKILLITSLLFFGWIATANAQISAGVYRLSSSTFASIGTDPDQKIFGEARVSTGRRVGIEGTFGYNFVQREDVNFYSGFHLGNEPRENLYLGIPLGLFIKPFTANRHFGFMMEASPIFPRHSGNYFRAGIGLKYVFR